MDFNGLDAKPGAASMRALAEAAVSLGLDAPEEPVAAKDAIIAALRERGADVFPEEERSRLDDALADAIGMDAAMTVAVAVGGDDDAVEAAMGTVPLAVKTAVADARVSDAARRKSSAPGDVSAHLEFLATASNAVAMLCGMYAKIATVGQREAYEVHGQAIEAYASLVAPHVEEMAEVGRLLA